MTSLAVLIGGGAAVLIGGGAAVLLAAVSALAVVAIAAAAGLAVSRRSLRRRLASLAARLGHEPATLPDEGGWDDTEEDEEARGDDLAGGGRSLETTLDRLERGAEQATETVETALAEAIRLQRALDAMPQGVVVCGEDGRVRFRNTRAAELMGSRRSDALAARAVEELLAAAAEGSPGERTLDLYGPPKRTLTLRTCAVDDGRRSLGVIAVLDDVSERRRLEAVRRDFVANVSHELKTPVGALGLLAETLSMETDPPVAKRLADRMQNEALRVGRIIDDLLDLSRIEAEEGHPRELVQVNLVMAEALDRVRATAETRQVELILDEPSPPLSVPADRRQLVSALHNLLENAVKYSDSGSQVTLSTSAGPDAPAGAGPERAEWVDLIVADHGIGIPTRDQERIFERFYRVDQGRSRQTGGTGLGLAIVRHVANNHGGRVWVESREGEGSTFTLRLPSGPDRGGPGPSSEP